MSHDDSSMVSSDVASVAEDYLHDEGIYVVESVRGMRRNPESEGLEYRIRWKNYGPDHDTWEPSENLLDGCEHLILAFHDKTGTTAEDIGDYVIDEDDEEDHQYPIDAHDPDTVLDEGQPAPEILIEEGDEEDVDHMPEPIEFEKPESPMAEESLSEKIIMEVDGDEEDEEHEKAQLEMDVEIEEVVMENPARDTPDAKTPPPRPQSEAGSIQSTGSSAVSSTKRPRKKGKARGYALVRKKKDDSSVTTKDDSIGDSGSEEEVSDYEIVEDPRVLLKDTFWHDLENGGVVFDWEKEGGRRSSRRSAAKEAVASIRSTSSASKSKQASSIKSDTSATSKSSRGRTRSRGRGRGRPQKAERKESDDEEEEQKEASDVEETSSKTSRRSGKPKKEVASEEDSAAEEIIIKTNRSTTSGKTESTDVHSEAPKTDTIRDIVDFVGSSASELSFPNEELSKAEEEALKKAELEEEKTKSPEPVKIEQKQKVDVKLEESKKEPVKEEEVKESKTTEESEKPAEAEQDKPKETITEKIADDKKDEDDEFMIPIRAKTVRKPLKPSEKSEGPKPDPFAPTKHQTPKSTPFAAPPSAPTKPAESLYSKKRMEALTRFTERLGLSVTIGETVADLIKADMRAHQSDKGRAVSQLDFVRAVLSGDAGLVEKAITWKKRNPTHPLDPEAPDQQGNTLLLQLCMRACQPSHQADDIMEYLVQAGADPNHTNKAGQTAMHLAVESKQLCKLLKLLSFRATPNLPDAHFITPLMLATKLGHSHLLLKLLEAGADYEATARMIVPGSSGPPQDATALDIALGMGSRKCEDILKSHSKRVKDAFDVALKQVLGQDVKIKREICPRHIFALTESDKFRVVFPFEPAPLPNIRYGFLIFVGIANFGSQHTVNVRFWGSCPIEKVEVNGGQVKAMQGEGRYVFLCSGLKAGFNEVRVSCAKDARESQAKIIIQVLLVQLKQKTPGQETFMQVNEPTTKNDWTRGF